MKNNKQLKLPYPNTLLEQSTAETYGNKFPVIQASITNDNFNHL